MFNLFCLSTSVFIYIIGVIIYHDINNTKPIIFQNIPIDFPKPNIKSTESMVLVQGNWSCKSTLSEYSSNIKISEMSEISEWWSDCHPVNKCEILNMWMSEEYDEFGEKSYHKYLKYRVPEINIKIVATNGSNTFPELPILNYSKLDNNKRYIFSEDECVSRFRFRSLLTGIYFHESTMNDNIIKSLMKNIGKIYEVTYYNKCDFKNYWGILDINNYCITKIKEVNEINGTTPSNVTNYNLLI